MITERMAWSEEMLGDDVDRPRRVLEKGGLRDPQGKGWVVYEPREGEYEPITDHDWNAA